MQGAFDGWDNELYHHGIKGQKWGVRRFQNPDGTLTAEGRARYGEGGTATVGERAAFLNRLDRQRALNVARAGQTKNAEKKNAHLRNAAVTQKTIDHVLNAAKKR